MADFTSAAKWAAVYAAVFGASFLSAYHLPEMVEALRADTALSGRGPMLAAIQSILTSVAIVVGGGWFLVRRGLAPRADIAHTVTHRWLSPAVLWIRSSVSVKNRGDVLVEIPEAEGRLLQVLPLAGNAGERIRAGQQARPKGRSDVDWPELAVCPDADPSFHVEPGETDTQNWDFVVSFADEEMRPQVVIVYHHLRNATKQPFRQAPVGWQTETVYDVKADSGSSVRTIDAGT